MDKVAVDTQKQALQNFLQIVSHDLAAPLRQVISFSEILYDEEAEKLSDDGKLYLQTITRASSKMQTMLDGLLELARIESRANDFADCDLNSALLAAKKATSSNVSSDSLPVIQGDFDQWVALFSALFNNAQQHANNDISLAIKVSVAAIDGSTVIVVGDNGAGFRGVPPERLFELFYTETDHDGQHAGVGLNLCKQICERHGGSISAQYSDAKGTQFIISLPTRQNAEI